MERWKSRIDFEVKLHLWIDILKNLDFQRYYQYEAARLEDSKHDAEMDLEESIKTAWVLNQSCSQNKPYFSQYTKIILSQV